MFILENFKNVILFRSKAFGRNIKESTATRYFIKVTAGLGFTQFEVIRRIKIENKIERRFKFKRRLK